MLGLLVFSCLKLLSSVQIQQLFGLMESSTVKSAIDSLIQARPGSSSSSPTNGGGANKEQAAVKRSTLKRRSNAGTSGWRCNCGKCTKCLPSPSGESLLLPAFQHV